MYATIKTVHAAAALITLGGFLLRGAWMYSGSELLQHRATRILPHIVDTVFLLSGVYLVFELGGGTLGQPWMLCKLLSLIAYIALATVALKAGRTAAVKATAFVAAIAVFAYAYGVSVSGSPASWIAVLASPATA
jgi:uncharacterized membrane protein SirB2